MVHEPVTYACLSDVPTLWIVHKKRLVRGVLVAARGEIPVEPKDVLFCMAAKILNVSAIIFPLSKLIPRLKKALGRDHLVEYSGENLL